MAGDRDRSRRRFADGRTMILPHLFLVLIRNRKRRQFHRPTVRQTDAGPPRPEKHSRVAGHPEMVAQLQSLNRGPRIGAPTTLRLSCLAPPNATRALLFVRCYCARPPSAIITVEHGAMEVSDRHRCGAGRRRRAIYPSAMASLATGLPRDARSRGVLLRSGFDRRRMGSASRLAQAERSDRRDSDSRCGCADSRCRCAESRCRALGSNARRWFLCALIRASQDSTASL